MKGLVYTSKFKKDLKRELVIPPESKGLHK